MISTPSTSNSGSNQRHAVRLRCALVVHLLALKMTLLVPSPTELGLLLLLQRGGDDVINRNYEHISSLFRLQQKKKGKENESPKSPNRPKSVSYQVVYLVNSH